VDENESGQHSGIRVSSGLVPSCLNLSWSSRTAVSAREMHVVFLSSRVLKGASVSLLLPLSLGLSRVV
jgi:hypothetical protein